MDRESYEVAMKTFQIQSTLSLKYGSFFEELPEQRMSVRYLTGKEKVLEIGGNIGRNSLIIARLLNSKQYNLVTLESNLEIAAQLKENRDANQLQFHIETSALSKRKLIQKGWDTLPSETLQEGYSWVNTMTLDEIQAKYNIVFDTLVLDCDGAFYYILMDMPEILANINLIIMENDYYELEKKQYVDNVLKQNGFYRDYAEGGGWGPCTDYFFEVWKK
jgi:FkbM family methyltransferase